MKKQYLPSLIGFSIIFLITFVGGFIGSIYSVRCLYLLIRLGNSEVSEKGIITSISKRSRTFNNTLYFTLENKETVYRESIFKITSINAKVGDEIEVVLNSKRNFFIIKNYITAQYITYIISIILIFIIFSFSILFGKIVIQLYKEAKVKYDPYNTPNKLKMMQEKFKRKR